MYYRAWLLKRNGINLGLVLSWRLNFLTIILLTWGKMRTFKARHISILQYSVNLENSNHSFSSPGHPAAYAMLSGSIWSICSESIHPFCWAETMTPCWLLIFGTVFLLKMTISFIFEPFPQHANITVTQFFSFPVVQILMVFSPVLLMVQFGGKSKVSGASSMLAMRWSA